MSDESGTDRALLHSVVDLLRAIAAAAERVTAGGVGALDGAPRAPLVTDPQLVSLMMEMALILAASGVRVLTGSVDAFTQAFTSINAKLVASGDSPDEAAVARAAAVDELRAGLRTLTSLSNHESRRALTQFDSIAQAATAAPAGEGDGQYWRRWTVKP